MTATIQYPADPESAALDLIVQIAEALPGGAPDGRRPPRDSEGNSRPNAGNAASSTARAGRVPLVAAMAPRSRTGQSRDNSQMTPTKHAAIAAIAATLLTIIAPAGTAHASEAGYLASLRIDYGLEIPPDEERYALQSGHFVCDTMHDGTPRETVAGLIRMYNDQLTPERQVTPEQMDGLIDAAQLKLCPDTAA